MPTRPRRLFASLPSSWARVPDPETMADGELVVGPGGGALVIAVPYRTGLVAGANRLTWQGMPTRDAQQARDAAWDASTWLTRIAGRYIPVLPVLVARTGCRPRISEPPIGYALTTRLGVPRVLARIPWTLRPTEVTGLIRAATTSRC